VRFSAGDWKSFMGMGLSTVTSRQPGGAGTGGGPSARAGTATEMTISTGRGL